MRGQAHSVTSATGEALEHRWLKRPRCFLGQRLPCEGRTGSLDDRDNLHFRLTPSAAAQEPDPEAQGSRPRAQAGGPPARRRAEYTSGEAPCGNGGRDSEFGPRSEPARQRAASRARASSSERYGWRGSRPGVLVPERNRSGLRETGKRPRRRRVVPWALSGEPEGAVGHRGLSLRRVLWRIVNMAHTVLDLCLRNESFVAV